MSGAPAECRSAQVQRARAAMLDGFIRLAKDVLHDDPRMHSVQLELHHDAHWDQMAVVASHDRFAMSGAAGSCDRLPSELCGRYFAWDNEQLALGAFHTHGLSLPGQDYASPLAIVYKRADGALQAAWLGTTGADAFTDLTELVPAPPLVGPEPELYAAILADPDAPGPRDVLRDAWLSRNDVRGELAALAEIGATGAARARVAELVLEHGRSWLGRLQSVIQLSGALFDRGPFVRRAIVRPEDFQDPWARPDEPGRAFAAVADAPEWATIEAITFTSPRGVVTPAMKGLRSIGPLTRHALSSFGSGSWRVEELEYVISTGREQHASLEALAALRLPLRRLRLRIGEPPDLAILTRASWWSELERLELWLDDTSLVEPYASSTDSVLACRAAFRAIAPRLPARCTLAAGALTVMQERSGWMITGDRTPRRLELSAPDGRREQGPEWAAALQLPLVDDWQPDADWLHFALGASG